MLPSSRQSTAKALQFSSSVPCNRDMMKQISFQVGVHKWIKLFDEPSAPLF